MWSGNTTTLSTIVSFCLCTLIFEPNNIKILLFLNKVHGKVEMCACFLSQSSFYWFWKGCGYVRPGVTGGKAAGMEVVAVPSIPKSHLYTEADEVINSLLDLQPELWGLPPFEDCKSQKTCVNVEVAFIFFSF